MPHNGLRLLLDLLDIRAVFSLVGMKVPDFLNRALGLLAGHIRLMQHGDGRFGPFSWRAHVSAKLIQEAPERADGGATPAPSPSKGGAGTSGIYRCKSGRSLLLVDVSHGIKRPMSGKSKAWFPGRHASTLSFEFSARGNTFGHQLR